MQDRRREARMMCADMVEVRWLAHRFRGRKRFRRPDRRLRRRLVGAFASAPASGRDCWAQRRGQIHADSQHRRARPARFRQCPRVRRTGRHSAAARAELGWVPQELALYPLLTCRENLDAFGRYQGCAAKPCAMASQWCLEWAALADRADSTVKTLSGGMRRRLNMAAGLVHRPRIVLLDEPTVGVDPQSRNRIFDMVAEAARPRHHRHLHHALYGRGRAPVRHHRHRRSWPRDRAGVQGRTGGASPLARRSDVLMRFAVQPATQRRWAAARGGTLQDGVAHFPVDRPTDIASLLDAAARDGWT
jgi:hypothetical protein